MPKHLPENSPENIIEYAATDPEAKPIERALALICLRLMNELSELRIRLASVESGCAVYDNRRDYDVNDETRAMAI